MQVLSLFLLMQEAIQMYVLQKYEPCGIKIYLTAFWNLIDLACPILVLISIAKSFADMKENTSTG